MVVKVTARMSIKEQQPSPQVGGAGRQHWFNSEIQLMM